jgi:hypothetical protein
LTEEEGGLSSFLTPLSILLAHSLSNISWFYSKGFLRLCFEDEKGSGFAWEFIMGESEG